MPYKFNNPGNIRPGEQWKGSSKRPDANFLQFDTLQNGFRAMLIDQRTKRNRGVKTIEEYIKIYAPEKDRNNPKAYADFVTRKTGLTNLPALSVQSLQIALAMAEMEHGTKPTESDLKAATAALTGLQKKNENIEPSFLPQLAGIIGLVGIFFYVAGRK